MSGPSDWFEVEEPKAKVESLKDKLKGAPEQKQDLFKDPPPVTEAWSCPHCAFVSQTSVA